MPTETPEEWHARMMGKIEKMAELDRKIARRQSIARVVAWIALLLAFFNAGIVLARYL